MRYHLILFAIFRQMVALFDSQLDAMGMVHVMQEVEFYVNRATHNERQPLVEDSPEQADHKFLSWVQPVSSTI